MFRRINGTRIRAHGTSLRLTPRGIGFAVGALIMLIGGWRLGAGDLVGLGLGVVAMLLLGFGIGTARRQHLQRSLRLGRIKVNRQIRPARLVNRDLASVTTQIVGGQTAKRRDGALPTRLSTARWQFADAMSDALHPFGFGANAQHLDIQQESVDLGTSRQLRYPVIAQAVGRWPLGPLLATTSDPFGLVQVRTRVGEPSAVTVWPQTVELPVAGLIPPLRGQFLAGSSVGAPDDAVLRGYVAGDDLRRIHWPTSARRGQLLVREEEGSAARAVSVLVDPGLLAVGSDPKNGSWALELAASIACSSLADGHATRIISAGDSRYISGQSEADELLLEQIVSLPRLNRGEAVTARLAAAAKLAHTNRGEALFAVLGPLDATEVAPIRALMTSGQPGYAWVLADDRRDAERTAAELRKAGWYAAATDADQEQLAAWSALFSPVAASTTNTTPRPSGSEKTGRKTVVEKLHRGARPNRDRDMAGVDR